MPNAKRTKLRRAIAGSARLATLLADELLTGICEEPAKAQVSADVLYAAHAHRKEARPLPGRPGLKVADALKNGGRARIPCPVGRPTIRSASWPSTRRRSGRRSPCTSTCA